MALPADIQSKTEVARGPWKFPFGFSVVGGLVGLGTVETGITASTTETQEAATQLSASFNSVDTATATDAVKLANLSEGQTQTVRNTTAVAIKIFPAVGQNINAAAVDAVDPVNLAGNGGTRMYVGTAGGVQVISVLLNPGS